jgi:hypothetical protein
MGHYRLACPDRQWARLAALTRSDLSGNFLDALGQGREAGRFCDKETPGDHGSVRPNPPRFGAGNIPKKHETKESENLKKCLTPDCAPE